MKTKTTRALSMAVLLAATAAPAVAHAAPAANPAAARSTHASRGSVRIDARVSKPWVGQRIPVTVTALFRDVESVTLEGQPQITSNALITSELAREPKQATELVDGVPTLVVRWTASVTPQAAGPLDLSVSIPARIRYREAAPRRDRVERWSGDDPFSGFGGFDEEMDAMFDRMRRRMQEDMQSVAGPAHERTMTLKASLPRTTVHALPKEGRPSSFTGAVGALDVTASASATRLRGSEPVTLRFVVDGDVDLDRVEMAGVAASDAWKVYPTHVVDDAGGDAHRKVFEQVIVPLHAGRLSVPPVELSSFDPQRGEYVTKRTAPIAIEVEASPSFASTSENPAPSAPSAPDEPIATASPREVAIASAPAALLVVAAAAMRLAAGRRRRGALRREMRDAAARGSAHEFFASAERLVTSSLSGRWGVPADVVTASTIRERLGERGEALASVLTAGQTLRFGRGDIERGTLRDLCKTIERSLRGAR